MFPQFDPTKATYLAELIVSILGLLLFLALAVLMIRRKQEGKNSEPGVSLTEQITVSDSPGVSYKELNPLSPEEQSERSSALKQAYQTWKTERLLQGEDRRSLFLRTGVEKNRLRYQLVATTQVQAFAILVSTLMAESDPQASTLVEALFANLLAHPAYGQSELSSWKFLPDLPRSPKLDPDPHAEAWVIYAMLAATSRWPAINRFHYMEIIPARMHALHGYLETLDPEMTGRQPFSGYLIKQLQSREPSLDWSALGESQELFYSQLEEEESFEGEPDTSRFGFSLLQLGLMALLDKDPEKLSAIRKVETGLRQLVEGFSSASSTEAEFSRLSMLACTVPAFLSLQERELCDRVWKELISTQPDKNDGLGATLKLLGMTILANRQI